MRLLPAICMILAFLSLLPVWGGNERTSRANELGTELYRIAGGAQTDREQFLLDALDSLSRCSPDAMERLRACGFLSEYYIVKSDYPAARIFLDRGYDLWEADTSAYDLYVDNPVNKILNGKAVYAMNCELNYEKAAKYLIDGLKLSERYSNEEDYVVIGSNLVVIDLMRENADGLDYAMKIYEYSQKQTDSYTRYYGAYTASLMYYLNRQYELAKKYIDEAYGYLPRSATRDMVFDYTTYANILYRTGDIAGAEKNYRTVLDNIGMRSEAMATYSYLSYGTFLRETGRCSEAESVLEKGLSLSKSNMYLMKYHRELAYVFEEMSDWHEAYLHHKQFHAIYDSVFTEKREWAINELTVKYETSRKEQIIQEKQMVIIRRERALLVISLIAAVVMSVLAILFLRYHSRERMYRKIVAQYNDSLNNERKLEARISGLEKQLRERDERQPGVEEAQADAGLGEIFARVEALMRDEKVWRDQGLTREKLAEKAGTNRTYLTKAINLHSEGMSFNQYVFSYRLREALQILSSKQMPVPLKAVYLEVGFSTNNTFYKLFKEKVGMTPAKYREKYIEITENDS